ncbi:TIGR00153 family protein [Ferrimonas lipolytica]|uniref:TIGR00153 family protein n=1 Tax=Ferrimonas lipolytica TaxID=2724191 RepID=A0A6H1UF71_9GAMM|nr:TIGR00153 family protein [Ferrimonas lipolytica]QIZ77747.1 TIGR00153 family protein [Ferrimonas lipolytica]
MPVNFLGVFAKSPIKPLEQHIDKVADAAERMVPFFQAVMDNRWEEAETIQRQISALEQEADTLKREIRMSLPSGIFMPVQRTDLLEIVTQQDKIANKAKDIAGRVIGRQSQVPELLQETFIAYVQRCVDAVKQAQKAINEMDDLLESGFRGREVTFVNELIQQLDAIEDDTDSMQVKLRRQLFSIENDLNPIDVMVFYKILEWIGDLADLAERVGARLELMLARS